MRDKKFWFSSLAILALGALTVWLSQPPKAEPITPGTPIILFGQVLRQGSYPHQEGLTLSQAILIHGQGLAQFAKARHIIIENKSFPEARYKPLLRVAIDVLEPVEDLLVGLFDLVDLGDWVPEISALRPVPGARAVIDLNKDANFPLLPGDLIIVPEIAISF